jgi:hypothetical protein
LALAAAMAAQGCTLLGWPLSPVEPTARPTPRQIRAPARWELLFCDAQPWVRRAVLRANQGMRQLGGRNRVALEEAAEGMDRSAERAQLFLQVVPGWRPGAPLISAELAMLREIRRTGLRLERAVESGVADPSRIAEIRDGMAAIRRALREQGRVAERADARGIPCAWRFD